MKKDKYIKQEPVHFILNERGKARHISAVRFRDRIVQRALCDNSLVPLIQNQLIHNNAASLKNKGTTFFRKQLRKDLLKAYNKYLAYLNNHSKNDYKHVNNDDKSEYDYHNNTMLINMPDDSHKHKSETSSYYLNNTTNNVNATDNNNANNADSNYDPWEAVFKADNTCNDSTQDSHIFYDSDCKQNCRYSESDDYNKCLHTSKTNKNGTLSEFHSKHDNLYVNMKSAPENADFDPWDSCFTDDCNNATPKPIIRTNDNNSKEKAYDDNHSNVNHDNSESLRVNADNHHEWINPHIVIFDYSNYFGSIDSKNAYMKLYDYYMSFAPHMSRHENNNVHKLLETIRIFIEDEPHLGLGNQTSQTMAIWFTNRIDHLASKYGYYGRYMDDGYCICPDGMTADEFTLMLTKELSKLGLTLNPTKIKIIKLACDNDTTISDSKLNNQHKNTINANNNGHHKFTILKRDYWFDNQNRLNIMMTRKSLKWNKHHTENVIRHSDGVNIPIRILISILLNMKANADMLTHKHGFINDYNEWFNRMTNNHGFNIDMKEPVKNSKNVWIRKNNG